jgi:hypothetical protein
LDEDLCGLYRDEDEHQMVRTCAYWLEGVLLLTVGSIGILGNLVAILVLHLERTASSSFNRLLAMLATFDTIFIVFTLLDYSLARVFFWPWAQESEVWVYLIPKVIYPLNNMTFCCSIYLTVMLAWERYLAVCHPNHYRMVNRAQTGYTRTILVYVLPVVLFSIVLNIPKFLETELVYNDTATVDVADSDTGTTAMGERPSNTDNGTLIDPPLSEGGGDFWSGVTVSDFSKPGGLNLRMSKLRNNSNYIAYYIFATRLLVTGLVPFGALVFFNYRIHLGLRTARLRVRDWKFPRRTPGATLRHQRMRTELNLAVVLVAIVLVFLTCNLPRLLLNLLELVLLHMETAAGGGSGDGSGTRCQGGGIILPAWFQCFTALSHLMLMTNASTNFLIYWSMSACFKSAIHSSLKAAVRNLARRCSSQKDRGGQASEKICVGGDTLGGHQDDDDGDVIGCGAGNGGFSLLALPTGPLSSSVSSSTRISSCHSSHQLHPVIVVTACSD